MLFPPTNAVRILTVSLGLAFTSLFIGLGSRCASRTGTWTSKTIEVPYEEVETYEE